MRIYLIVNAVTWLGYGLYCLIDPAALDRNASVVAGAATGTTEIRAMYGGLQTALGVLCGVALMRPDFVRPAVITLTFVFAGLGSGRLVGAGIDGGVSTYTATALIFEFVFAALGARLLAREQPS